MDSEDFDLEEYQYLYNYSSPFWAESYLRVEVLHSVGIYQILPLVLYVPTEIIGLVGNVTVLLAFFIDRKQLLKVNFNLFIVNLTVIDLLICTIDMPFSTIWTYKETFWPKNDAGCTMVLFDDLMLTLCSMMTLVGISIDRYWAACWSQHYRIHNTRKRTLIFIAFIWFSTFILTLPTFIGGRAITPTAYFCYISTSAVGFLMFLNVFGNHLPSVIMLACTFKVYQQVWKRYKASVRPLTITIGSQTAQMQQLNAATLIDRATHSSFSNAAAGTRILMVQDSMPAVEAAMTSFVQNDDKSQTNQTVLSTDQREAVRSITTHQSKEAKIFNSLRYVVAAYLILWTPYNVYESLVVFWSVVFPYEHLTYVIVSGMYYMSSAVNPFMYALQNQRIKKAIARVPRFVFRY